MKVHRLDTRRIWLSLLVVWLSVCGAALRAEWVAAAYLGGAHTVGSSIELSQPAGGTQLLISPVEYETRSFSRPLYYSLRVGYFLDTVSAVGIEAEFIHSKVFARTDRNAHVRGQRAGAPVDQRLTIREIVQDFSISHGMNLLVANVAVRHAIKRDPGDRRGSVLLLARAGVGPTIPHPESSIGGSSLQRYELGSLAFQYAGGAEIRLWRDLYASLEYKFTHTRQSVSITDGRAKTLLQMHHAVAGLSYHF